MESYNIVIKFLSEYNFNPQTDYSRIVLREDFPSIEIVRESYDYIYACYIQYISFYINSDEDEEFIRHNKNIVFEIVLNIVNLLNFMDPL